MLWLVENKKTHAKCVGFEVPTGFEPVYELLQSSA